MAEPRINLNNFKSSGVYTVEIDASENVVLPLTTGRLIVGSSRVGPFNTVVLINDVRTLKAVFGDIDPKLEKAGSYFHRSIEVALREGPVFALNVMPLDTEDDTNLNLDKAYFTTFNTEAASNNSSSVPDQWPAVNFFNRRRLWFADSAELNKSKNFALGDDYITNPGGFGISTIESNKVLSFVNLGNTNVTVWVRRAAVTGFDVTAKEWYSSVGVTDIDFPSFVHPDDFISDYFVEVIVISGEWNNYLKLSKDPIYSAFFDAAGLKSSKAADFFALREIKVVSRTVGCLIPEFTDQSGTTVSIDRLLNRAFPTTGILCALDADKLDLVDLTNDTFIDQDVTTHRIDLVGHGYDDLNDQDVYLIDDGGYDITSDPADVTPLIDTLSYTRPADGELIYTITNNPSAPTTLSEARFLAGFQEELPGSTPVQQSDIYLVTTPAPVTYLVATEGSRLYDAYAKGFLKTGDTLVDGVNTTYLKVTDNLKVGSINYIKIEAFLDVTLLNQQDINYYTGPDSEDYIKVILDGGEDFKEIFDLTDTAFFTDYTVLQPNKLVLGINTLNTANKARIDEFIKVNNFIKARVTADSRARLLKIISVTSKEDLSPYRLEYTVTTMAPSVEEVIGIDADSNEIKVYKGIYNFVTSIKGQNLKPFKLRDALLPNGTADRLEGDNGILNYLYTSTSIPQALSNGELIDFRYVVDSYAGTISQSSKYHLVKLAALNGQAMALVNAPSVQQFERSVDPSFIDRTTKLVSTAYIAQGGDLSLNPSFTYKFAEEDVKGVPLSSYGSYHFPNLIVRSGTKNISVPQAAYISNLYVRKFKNGTPFLIVAGGKRGALNDPEIVGLEYDLTDEDRDFLEPAGFNLTVKRRGFGIILFSNNTAYQRINSALNNAHVRDNLSTIERDIEKILFNFLFDFNDEITRLRVRTIVENYMTAVLNARGVSSFEVIFDSSNNTGEVISANAAIIDIRIDFPRGIQKFINRITITRVGGQLSSESTGFIPSF
ncbi:hypothetical protein UFOVP699_46 [uncultured Caudovirales phage]|uniref:Tail sheath protein n=1 Tax=uncultured Caudovirales phage TaxID=2100421 RepID=A0A6J5NUP1_9CAUD|nr:hypothetical protein UFOVP699_46 [uncultured Caudovirales phage]